MQTSNATVLTGLAPGDYLIANTRALINNTGAVLNQPSGATPIHLSSSDRTITTTLPDPSALAHVHIQLQFANGAAPPAILPIGLVPAGAGAATQALLSRNVAAKGDTVFDVPPGDYSFTTGPNSSGRPARTWFIRRITADGKLLPADSIHLAAGDSSFMLTLVSGDRTLRGFVVRTAAPAAQPQPAPTAALGNAVIPSEGAPAPQSRARPERGEAETNGERISSPQMQSEGAPQPAPGVFLLLVPVEDGQPRHFWRQQSDLDGSFTFTGLTPGAYTLYAIDGGWDLDWQLAGALDRYLPTAARITLPDALPLDITFPQPIHAQPK